MAKAKKVVNEVPVRLKVKAPVTTLQVGELSRYEDGSIWRVERVGKGSADVRCLVSGASNNVAGRYVTISPSRAGHVIVQETDVDLAKALADVSKEMCDRCWAKHGQDAPCDIECWCHEKKYQPRKHYEPTAEEAEQALELRKTGMGYAKIDEAIWPDLKGESKGGRSYGIIKKIGGGLPELAAPAVGTRAKWVPTDEERAKIVELRAKGLGYAKIDEAMGWPEKKGGRSYSVVGPKK